MAYSLFKRENFPQNGEGLTRFLMRMINQSQLTPARTQALYDRFFGS